MASGIGRATIAVKAPGPKTCRRFCLLDHQPVSLDRNMPSNLIELQDAEYGTRYQRSKTKLYFLASGAAGYARRGG